MNEAERNAELKRQLRKDLDAPDFNSVWRHLERIGSVQEVLDNRYLYEDLLDDGKVHAEYQRSEREHEASREDARAPGPAEPERDRHTDFPAEEVELSRYEWERSRAESAFHAVEAAATGDARRFRKLPVLPRRLRTKVREKLAKRLPWTGEQVEKFLLTGEYPEIPPLTGTLETGKDSKITITAEPWVSADTVRRFYLQIQSHTEGKVKQDTAEGAAVLRFVLEQVLKEGERPSWAELQIRWNAAHPKRRLDYKDALRKAAVRAYWHIAYPIHDRRGYSAHRLTARIAVLRHGP